MPNTNETNHTNVKNALCYIPFVAVVLALIEENKTPELKKHIKYGIAFLLVYTILNFILGWAFGWILVLIYLIVSGWFGYKAYNWEDFEIEHIDKAQEKIKEKL